MQFFAALYEDFRAFPDYLSTGGVWPRSEHDPWLLEALKNTTKPDSGVWTEIVLPQAPTRVDVGSCGGLRLGRCSSRSTGRLPGPWPTRRSG